MLLDILRVLELIALLGLQSVKLEMKPFQIYMS